MFAGLITISIIQPNMISHSEIVNVPLATVWEHFLYKIDHPEHFVPGVSGVVIKEKTANYTIREMNIAQPDGKSIRFSEKITASPYLVKFLIIEHPLYEGYVDNIAEAISPNETKITYSINWVNKTTGEAFAHQPIVTNAVIKSVAFILEAELDK